HKTANPNDDPEKSTDEEDLQERSTKKKKDGEHIFSTHSSLPKDYSDVVSMQMNEKVGGSYSDKVTGRTAEWGDGSDEDKEDQGREEEAEGDNMKVEECLVGDYE
ncbi:hypothetical protein A2U01_0069363, partial [Trifolium medium]|nr:hypothetical protein [Trifolium medium]